MAEACQTYLVYRHDLACHVAIKGGSIYEFRLYPLVLLACKADIDGCVAKLAAMNQAILNSDETDEVCPLGRHGR